MGLAIQKGGETISFSEIKDQLQSHFENEEVGWYIQNAWQKNGSWQGYLVPFLSRSAILKRLNDVIGPENWENDFQVNSAGHFQHVIRFYLVDEETGEQVIREKKDAAVAMGSGDEAKSGATNSFKRAATLWDIGRYVYSADAVFSNDLYGSYQDVDGSDVLSDRVEDNNGQYHTLYFARPDVKEALNSNASLSTNGGAKNKKSGGSTSSKSNSTSNNSQAYQNTQEFSRDYKWPFGKYEGTPIRDLDKDYLRDYVLPNFDDKPQLRKFAAKELSARDEFGISDLEEKVNQIDGVTMQDVAAQLRDKYEVTDFYEIPVELLDDIIETFQQYLDDGAIRKDSHGNVKLVNNQPNDAEPATAGASSDDNLDELNEHFNQ